MAERDEMPLLDRAEVTRSLEEALELKEFVHAFWEGGAAASGTLDQWSDLDLYLLVDDDRVDEAFAEVERVLQGLSDVRLKLPVPDTGWSGVHQSFYKLVRMSEYHIIDLAVVTLSAEEKFLEPTVHGEARFAFNKLGAIEFPPYDEEAVRKRVSERKRRLSDRIEMFGAFLPKEVNRGNSIEAVDLYHRLFFSTLLELLRMKHRPEHSGFGTRHTHRELPEPVVAQLVELAFVRDTDDLVSKQAQVRSWISALLCEPD
ncbi:TPA: hypothetical protein HA259_00410 [Thermoplasmata archaeon]|nr:hypothetical protein [Thermoplasmata archaeon]